jgi:hypothetical protein
MANTPEAIMPKLNSTESLWAYLKENPLANAVYFDYGTLAGVTRSNSRSILYGQDLLRSFIQQWMQLKILCPFQDNCIQFHRLFSKFN